MQNESFFSTKLLDAHADIPPESSTGQGAYKALWMRYRNAPGFVELTEDQLRFQADAQRRSGGVSGG